MIRDTLSAVSDGSADESAYDEQLDVVVHRVVESPARSRLTRTGVGGGGLLAFAVIGAYLGLPTSLAVIAGGIGLIMLRVAAESTTSHTRNETRSARVRASPSGIRVEGSPFIQADTIARAYVQPREGARTTVRCLDESNDVLFEAEVDDERDAEAFLRAMRRDVTHQRQGYRLLSPIGATIPRRLGMLLCAIALPIAVFPLVTRMGLHGGAALIAAGLSFFAPIFLMALTARLDVGSDGLLLSWFTQRSFIPYDRVRRVERVGITVKVTLVDGTTVPLELPGGRRFGRDLELEPEALRVRINEARDAHRGVSGDVRALEERLARGARPVAEWRKALGALQAGEGGGYRGIATREEDLWRVVEDGRAPEEARAAAALALRANSEAAPRLRIAAEAVASPRLRVALETAADPAAEEAALDEALASFEAEAPEKHEV